VQPPAAIVATMPSAKPRRVRLTAAERRAQLIRIAQEVYLDVGIDRTSVLKVARAAGVNNATIYQHFSSTAELFEEAVLRPLERTLDEELTAAESRLNGLDSAERLNEMHLALASTMARIGRMLNAILFANNAVGRRCFADQLHPRLVSWITDQLSAAGQPTTGPAAAAAPGILGVHLWLAMHSEYRGDGNTHGWTAGIADFLNAGLEQALPMTVQR